MATALYLQPTLLESGLKEPSMDARPEPVVMTQEDVERDIAGMNEDEIMAYTADLLAKNLSGGVVCMIL